MRGTSFVKIKEFLLDKTEPNIENIKTFFSEEEISYINDTTPDEFVEIYSIEDTEIKEKYKKLELLFLIHIYKVILWKTKRMMKKLI